jgi:transcriptional regulator with XRE-family HTH domain
MATKSQHSEEYQRLPPFLRAMRERAGLTQRDLGTRLGKPQSWVYNCETGNRRVDLTEFIAWARACGADAVESLRGFIADGSETADAGARQAPTVPRATGPQKKPGRGKKK